MGNAIKLAVRVEPFDKLRINFSSEADEVEA
jgi:hypothetical protein